MGAVDEVFAELDQAPPVPPAPRRSVAALAPPIDSPPAYRREPIPLEWAEDICFDPLGIHEIVEDVFGARRMSVTYGDSNAGKTTLMLDLALRMPAGLPWLGKRVEPSAVLYIAAESPNSVRLRLEAFRRHHDCRVGAFAIVPSTLNMLDPSVDVEDLVELIQRESKGLDLPIRFLIVDTVARVMAGANENAGEDMTRLVAAGDRLREATGAHVNWIHHSGKEAARGARGHSSLRAAVDTEIEVTCDDSTGVRTLEVTKQRDIGSKGLRLSARFRAIELGTNQWGKPITACVVEPVEEASAHLQAVIATVENERAEAIAVAGFRRLRDQGVMPTDGKTSADYLPRQLVDKGLADGFQKDQLEAAMNRLMTRGIFKRDTVGHYTNRNPRFGLVLTNSDGV